MNEERLLDVYEQISEAPDAIARLRRFVLDLAVRGKLVEQDAGDEPASELLKRIELEKARRIEAGEIKNRKVRARERTEPLVVNVPAGWSLTDLGTVSIKITDGAHKTPTYVDKGVPFVSVKDFSGGRLSLADTRYIPEAEHEVLFQRCDPRRGDILLGRIGTLGKAVLIDTDAEFSLFVSVGLIRFDHDSLVPEFFRLLLNSPFVEEEFDRIKVGGGTHTNKLNLGDLHTVALLIPPLAEQHRIVGKVDELMVLCDRLEEARKTREEVRDKLTAASLVRLTAQDASAEDFPTHAAFALEALPALTTRPDQIKTLRQTILNLAVRGKLVEQDTADEPAAELLDAIAAEQNELAKAGKIKRPKPLPPVDTTLAPFDLPLGWSWARFPELGAFGRGKSKHRPRNDPALYRDGNVPFIQTGDVARSGGRITSNTGFYNEVGLAQSMLWPRGTMCITIAANIADSGILDFDACFPDSVVGLVPASMFDNARYFEYFIRTAKANLLEFAPATAQKNINLGILETVLIPLPPLTEQHRIVAKVDTLMALFDRMEAALTTADTTRTRLLEALLHEALEPTTDTLEAAE
ncbi:MAG: restriction endonuclease subunit S [Thalassococcus sp.]|uniref:restriction endonuclease subunit S n=1 Tax=Thalassococcus sp. TaxID=1928858 RepID=UPI001B2A5057|nr:restriction endonuclease subunit S [Thalassococcus sp.]MBO6865396.1 restriction endonuclease subunit S [Thalassococcus sp.]